MPPRCQSDATGHRGRVAGADLDTDSGDRFDSDACISAVKHIHGHTGRDANPAPIAYADANLICCPTA